MKELLTRTHVSQGSFFLNSTIHFINSHFTPLYDGDLSLACRLVVNIAFDTLLYGGLVLNDIIRLL